MKENKGIMPQERRSKIISCSDNIGSVQRGSQSSVKRRRPKCGTSLNKCSPSPVACAKHDKDECAEKLLQVCLPFPNIVVLSPAHCS